MKDNALETNEMEQVNCVKGNSFQMKKNNKKKWVLDLVCFVIYKKYLLKNNFSIIFYYKLTF